MQANNDIVASPDDIYYASHSKQVLLSKGVKFTLSIATDQYGLPTAASIIDIDRMNATVDSDGKPELAPYPKLIGDSFKMIRQYHDDWGGFYLKNRDAIQTIYLIP